MKRSRASFKIIAISILAGILVAGCSFQRDKTEDPPLEFHDPQFEAACAEAIGRPVGEVRASDLQGIENLSVYEGKIFFDEDDNPDAAYATSRAFYEGEVEYPTVDLTDLRLFPNLKMLNLQFIEPKELDASTEMNLRYLGLYGITLESWDAVNKLTGLQDINIVATTAEEGKLNFSNFQNLKTVSLNMPFADQWAEEFTGLETLHDLRIMDGVCMFGALDLSFLSGMTELEWCDLKLPEGTDIGVFGNHTKLRSLCLTGVAEGTDFTKILELPKLEVLGLCRTNEPSEDGTYMVDGKASSMKTVMGRHIVVFEEVIADILAEA